MEQNNNQNINILNIVKVFLSHWLLFLVFAIIFLSLAFLYLRFAAKTYQVYSRVIINTQNNVNTRSGGYLDVGDLMNQEKIFANEIAYLRSTPLIKEVVNDMNLATSYFIKADRIPKQLKFGFVNIYKESPFIVIMDESSPQPLNTLFYLNIIDNETFMIDAETFHAYMYHPDKEIINNYESYFAFNGIFKFGESIGNEQCSFRVLLNSNYNDEQYRGVDFFFEFNSPQILAERFRENLEISTAFFESSIVDLSFEGENVDLSLEFLNKLIDKYIEKNLDKKNFDANNTIDYINTQLERMSGTLGQSEEQLQNFRRNRDVMNIDDKTASVLTRLQNLREEKNELDIQKQNLSEIYNYFEENKDSDDFIAPSIGFQDQTLVTLVQELTTLISERQNLISRNQIRSPRLRTIEINIKNINKVISDNIKFNLSALDNELIDINRRINLLEREASSLPRTQRQLIGLEREFTINNSVYTALLNNKMEAQIAKASTRSDCEIIEPVRYEEIASPSYKKTLFIALFLALFFPGSYVATRLLLSNKIQTADELSRFSSIPLAGRIPHVQKEPKNILKNSPQSPAAESFHALRSNILYYLLGEKHCSILITSSLPNEGKTLSSLNLATSFAMTNNKTLLINFDLRKKNYFLNEFQSEETSYGLSSYLIKKSSMEEIVLSTNVSNLDYIDAGEIPPDPVSLISTERTQELINQAKKNYDYVIVDTPPYALVTDAFLLMKHADLIVYVSRLGVLTKKVFKNSIADIRNKNIKNIYLLQNDGTKIDKSYSEKYYYGYYYKNKRKTIFKNPFKKRK